MVDCCEPDWKKLPSLGIMKAQLRVPLKALEPSQLYCIEGFKAYTYNCTAMLGLMLV